MRIEQQRLLALIEFAQQSARLRSKPASALSQHGGFILYEQSIQGLPGIHLNVGDAESDDEIWLSVERLHEARPPASGNAVLVPWMVLSPNPAEEPRLKEVTDGQSLILAGTHRSSLKPPENLAEAQKPEIDPAASIALEDHEQWVFSRARFKTYVDTRWKPWAEEEKLKRYLGPWGIEHEQCA